MAVTCVSFAPSQPRLLEHLEFYLFQKVWIRSAAKASIDPTPDWFLDMQHTMFVLKKVIFVKLPQLQIKSPFKKIIKCVPKNTANVQLK